MDPTDRDEHVRAISTAVYATSMLAVGGADLAVAEMEQVIKRLMAEKSISVICQWKRMESIHHFPRGPTHLPETNEILWEWGAGTTETFLQALGAQWPAVLGPAVKWFMDTNFTMPLNAPTDAGYYGSALQTVEKASWPATTTLTLHLLMRAFLDGQIVNMFGGDNAATFLRLIERGLVLPQQLPERVQKAAQGFGELLATPKKLDKLGNRHCGGVLSVRIALGNGWIVGIVVLLHAPCRLYTRNAGATAELTRQIALLNARLALAIGLQLPDAPPCEASITPGVVKLLKAANNTPAAIMQVCKDHGVLADLKHHELIVLERNVQLARAVVNRTPHPKLPELDERSDLCVGTALTWLAVKRALEGKGPTPTTTDLCTLACYLPVAISARAERTRLQLEWRREPAAFRDRALEALRNAGFQHVQISDELLEEWSALHDAHANDRTYEVLCACGAMIKILTNRHTNNGNVTKSTALECVRAACDVFYDGRQLRGCFSGTLALYAVGKQQPLPEAAWRTVRFAAPAHAHWYLIALRASRHWLTGNEMHALHLVEQYSVVRAQELHFTAPCIHGATICVNTSQAYILKKKWCERCCEGAPPKDVPLVMILDRCV